jgi:hypothetical protein
VQSDSHFPLFPRIDLPNPMAEVMSSVLISAFFSAFLSLAGYICWRKQSPLPPGPRPWPVLGNALDMPKEKSWLRYTEWGRTYGRSQSLPLSARTLTHISTTLSFLGDVVSLTIFGRTLVILNSAKAAFDLLHKRSSIYSDRPYMAMGGEL